MWEFDYLENPSNQFPERFTKRLVPFKQTDGLEIVKALLAENCRIVEQEQWRKGDIIAYIEK